MVIANIVPALPVKFLLKGYEGKRLQPVGITNVFHVRLQTWRVSRMPLQTPLRSDLNLSSLEGFPAGGDTALRSHIQ